MYLAKVDSEEEFEFLRNLIAEGVKHNSLKQDNFVYYFYTLFLDESFFLVDGTDEQTEGQWRSLDDGQLLSYMNSDGNVWHSGQPNGGSGENCAMVSRSRSGLSDISCSRTRGAFCEIED